MKSENEEDKRREEVLERRINKYKKETNNRKFPIKKSNA